MTFKYYDVSFRQRRHRRHRLWWLWPYVAGFTSGAVVILITLN